MSSVQYKIPVNPPFALGADVSWLPMMEADGFPFKDRNGEPKECLLTLKEFGLNAVRLRAFINPSDDHHSGHCSTEETLAMGLRAQKLGFDVMVDFHYGDSWRDPNNQRKPDAWEKLSFDDLLKAVFNYTQGAMRAFIAGGLTPKWAQIGNETNPGLLVPDGDTDHFDQLTKIYNAGHDAVKSISPQTQTMIHLAEGNKTDFLINYFDELTRHDCRYDMIGLSYYPWWLKTTNREIINGLEQSLNELPIRYNKDIMVVETGGEDDKEQESYDLLASVLEKCAAAPRCRGMFYWEPEGAKAWSRYGLSAWRGDGTPSMAMDAYLLASQQER